MLLLLLFIERGAGITTDDGLRVTHLGLLEIVNGLLPGQVGTTLDAFCCHAHEFTAKILQRLLVHWEVRGVLSAFGFQDSGAAYPDF